MEPTPVTAAIAAAGVIVGATVAAAASYFSTKHKLREMEVAATQRLRENYLQNARDYTKSIYIPLVLAVSRLYDAYNSYQENPAAPDRGGIFRAAIDVFLSEVRRLRDGGAEAFLTNELEDRLRYFTEFLVASIAATSVRRKVVIGYRASVGGLTIGNSMALTVTGKRALLARSGALSIDVFGFGITYEAEQVLAAPLNSVEFNRRFVSDSSEIRILIKEVTLGGKPKG
jgi:hypothetical protein